MRPQIVLVVLAVFLAAVSAAEEHRHRHLHHRSAVGEWKPIKELKNRVVVEMASFAVWKHNEQTKSHLKLESIVKGDTQAVAHGTRYRLILATGTGKDGSNRYEAIVSRKLFQHRWEKELTSFNKLLNPSH